MVSITEETEYPFEGTIRLAVGAEEPVRFPLYLRVPAWCESGQLKINGMPVEVQWAPAAYVRIERVWSAGDTLSLTLDMPVRVKVWEKNKNAVSVSRGALSFSLKIDERWEAYGTDSAWTEWEVFPASPWNYGLVLNPDDPARSFTVKRREPDLLARPWTVGAMPVVLAGAGRRIEGWQQDYRGLIGPLQGSPARTDAPRGAAHLCADGGGASARNRIPDRDHGFRRCDMGAARTAPSHPVFHQLFVLQQV